MTRDELVRKLIELRPKPEAEGVAHLALFGSRARGDNRDDSDIDVLVDVAPDAKFSLLDLISVEQLLAAETGVAAQGTMRRSLSSRLRERITRDIVEIF
jgi:hypothetical protein